ncbi:helix-turn-helix domain-containing protein [Rudanella paleaurantiibacter]|uniref:Helix-turn-helix domain-containing protein n=1 Tax=Rudanella paleaurantiibacter TaxID=2614655 RepID=A0A7J5U7Y4_9BACT|nr:helix-turn-helix domain-containing protein [Rudanella paleaurantiibacter]
MGTITSFTSALGPGALLRLVLTLWLTGLGSWTMAQVRVEVVAYPPMPDSVQRLFMACDFNNWTPGDPRFELRRQPNGHYVLNLPQTPPRFEYKFTRGYWALAEGTATGGNRPNRTYNIATANPPGQIMAQIAGWEATPTYQFVITDIPPNTPHDAALYISGNFNNWNSGDELFRLRRHIDGSYRVTVATDLDRIEYKFTRGTWPSVEGTGSGRARPNRVLFRSSQNTSEPIRLQIASWEDLSGSFNFFSIYDLLLLFSAFQSVLLIIALVSLQNYNREANRWLILALASAALLLLIRVVSAYPNIAQTYTHLLLVPDFVMLLYAPMFYFYIRRLLFRPPRLPRRWWLHFVPAGIQLIVYLPFFFMELKPLQLRIVNHDPALQWVFQGVGAVAWGINLVYWIVCWRALRSYERRFTTEASHDQNLRYLNTVMAIQAVCLLLWFVVGLFIAAGSWFPLELSLIWRQSIDLIWLAFSTIPYFLGYFAIQQPEIFKMPAAGSIPLFEAQPEPEPTGGILPDPVVQRPLTPPIIRQVQPEAVKIALAAPAENLLPYREQLDALMAEKKPYINAGLTLNELAAMLHISPHLLSRVINESYGRNFFDFVNSHRIEEFKRRYDDAQNRHYTLLGLAFDVGFNSKTAFNRAFKKITNQTPRDYFQEPRLEE